MFSHKLNKNYSTLDSLDLSSNKFLRLSRGWNLKISSSSSFLFLHHGLSSSDLTLLRSIFLRLGLNITHVPLRFWSKYTPITPYSSHNHDNKLFHGGLFIVHSSSSSYNSNLNSDPNSNFSSSLFYFYRRLFSSSSLSFNWSSLYFPQSTTHPIIPWDNFSSSIIDIPKNNSFYFNTWFEQDPFTLFFNYISSNNITYAGNLNNLSFFSSSLNFESFDHLNNSKYDIDHYTILINKTLFNLDPYFFSCFHRKFIFFFQFNLNFLQFFFHLCFLQILMVLLTFIYF